MFGTLLLVRMEADQQAPPGSAHEYEFVIPVDSHRRLDTWAWHQERGACTVKRAAAATAPRIGIVTQCHDGVWAFSYDVGNANEERLPKFNQQPFVIGRTVDVVTPTGTTATFKIVEMGPAIICDPLP